ncbi:MAG TPA: hypothetical protein VFD32_23205 [Dehalococcoidia bacterium]|nr:hypothetical protein [Dehalococcoidia bacterium]
MDVEDGVAGGVPVTVGGGVGEGGVAEGVGGGEAEAVTVSVTVTVTVGSVGRGSEGVRLSDDALGSCASERSASLPEPGKSPSATSICAATSMANARTRLRSTPCERERTGPPLEGLRGARVATAAHTVAVSAVAVNSPF